MPKVYACDTETTGLDFNTCKLLCFAYWSPTDSGCIVDPNHVREWFVVNSNSTLIWQNGKFDQKIINNTCNVWPQNSIDTLLGAALLPNKPEKLGLGDLVEHYLGVPSYKESEFIKNLENEPLDKVKDYCMVDCESTYKVAQYIIKDLVETGNWEFFTKYIMPASDILARAECKGVNINKEILLSELDSKMKLLIELDSYMRDKYKDLVNEYEVNQVNAYLEKNPKTKKTKEELLVLPKYKFNFSSAKQKLWLLNEKLGFKCEEISFKSGKRVSKKSIGKDVIEEYFGEHPIIEDLLNITSIETQVKMMTSYMEAMSISNSIHTNYTMDVTRTGRLSSKEPNLQNIKRDED